MKFNFGATPFQHEPVADHIAIEKAPEKNSKVSSIVGMDILHSPCEL